MLLRHSRRKYIFLTIASTALFAYAGICTFLYIQQRQLIYRPDSKIIDLPSNSHYRLNYEDVWIPITGSNEKLHGWWFPTLASNNSTSSPEKPTQVLTPPKTILYLHGTAGNISHNLPRIEGLLQLGFSVLAIDYRGYGQSEGSSPSELQLYQDSQSAWEYLLQSRAVPPQQILIYGESLGGAISLDLAIKKPNAGGLILQSTFTSIVEVANQSDWMKAIPVSLLINQKFDSIEKIKSLQVPVLLIHGLNDSGIPSRMSQKLYDLAPNRKQLFLIPDGEHARIYDPKHSYLKAIQQFVSN
jgi:fermentation-respiration switch protein FrsA (DUF1100 family)